MRGRLVGLAFAVVLFGARPLSSQTPCDTAFTQSDLNICAYQAADRSEKKLQALLGELRARLDSTRFRQLQRVQVKWQTYRSAHCSWEGDAVSGGSMTPMVVSGCYRALTEERIQDLKLNLCEGEGEAGECDASHRYDVPKSPVDSQPRY